MKKPGNTRKQSSLKDAVIKASGDTPRLVVERRISEITELQRLNYSLARIWESLKDYPDVTFSRATFYTVMREIADDKRRLIREENVPPSEVPVDSSVQTPAEPQFDEVQKPLTSEDIAALYDEKSKTRKKGN